MLRATKSKASCILCTGFRKYEITRDKSWLVGIYKNLYKEIMSELNSRKFAERKVQEIDTVASGTKEIRQVERMAEVKRYWGEEIKLLKALGTKAWIETGIETDTINTSCMRVYTESMNICTLKRISANKYIDERIRGCEMFQQKTTGSYDVVFDGTNFLKVKHSLEHCHHNNGLIDVYYVESSKQRLMTWDALRLSTFDSYLINTGKKYKTVYLDEGLMLQPGEIDIVAMISNAENVYVYGDKKQLNFIYRVADFRATYVTFEDFSEM